MMPPGAEKLDEVFRSNLGSGAIALASFRDATRHLAGDRREHAIQLPDSGLTRIVGDDLVHDP